MAHCSGEETAGSNCASELEPAARPAARGMITAIVATACCEKIRVLHCGGSAAAGGWLPPQWQREFANGEPDSCESDWPAPSEASARQQGEGSDAQQLPTVSMQPSELADDAVAQHGQAGVIATAAGDACPHCPRQGHEVRSNSEPLSGSAMIAAQTAEYCAIRWKKNITEMLSLDRGAGRPRELAPCQSSAGFT
jgi:hypothetical protein